MLKLNKKFNKFNKVRTGVLETGHGKLETPFFMPDATRGCVKLVGNKELDQTGVEAMVVNTFHLYLQPGMKVIKKFGGIHNFMNWPGPLLSDSGGYQVFSLAHKKGMGKITDKGVVFKSPIDGSMHELTPEKSIQIQFELGVDGMVCLDDCPPNESNRAEMEKSVERTIKWAKRCRREYDKRIKNQESRIKNYIKPLLFGVIQGGTELDLRKKCAEELIKLDFDGYGFGARPVDDEGQFLEEVLQYTADLIPEDKLRFALGIGNPEDILRCAEMGWDMFDCVIPTREGRHGRLYVKKQDTRYNFQKSSKLQDPISKKAPSFKFQVPEFYTVININNSKFKTDTKPIDESCDCELCQNYSAGYLHHLFKIKEPLGARLAAIHNLKFYSRLMEGIRQNRR